MTRFRLLLCVLCVSAVNTLAADRPNVIVILADDWGYADLSAQGCVPDVRTPNIDRMAAAGVRCTAGYVTAPQCSPSRAGLITGRYQQRFGFDTIPDCPLPLEQQTLAERLRPAGYTSGMIGKWHLHPNPTSKKWIAEHLPESKSGRRGSVAIPPQMALEYYPHRQGFDDVFAGEIHRYFANYDLAGRTLPAPAWINDDNNRIDVQTDAALAFLKRNHAKPFFLYLCYYAPHVPLEATDRYLSRFPGAMPERRRAALAMMSAVDDGVGRVLDALRQYNIEDNTLVVFTSDNGAPLKLTKADAQPINVPSGDWDGSLNDPLLGEKGMLTEGGIRVPFVLQWKSTLPAGRVYDQPVSTLDIAATAVAAAGIPINPSLDGVNVVPHLGGASADAPHPALFWRFWNQSAVRAGRWKLMHLGDGAEFLFDLHSPEPERANLVQSHPTEAAELRRLLTTWCSQLDPPGLPNQPLNSQERVWYRHYLGH